MRLTLFLLGACGLAAQPPLRIEPALATDCNLVGRTTVRLVWEAREPVQIRAASGEGSVPMTGTLPATGEVPSGPWVTDGLTFLLVSTSGAELGRAQARVRCVRPAAESLFPLQAGYQWTYRTRNRQATGGTVTLRVVNAAEADGMVWFEVRRENSPYAWLAEDERGRIWRRERWEAPAALWVDPGSGARTVLDGPLGPREGALEVVQTEPLSRTRRVFAPGLGLAWLESTLSTGSSGGFTEGWELVAYELGERSGEERSEITLKLAAEARTLDITNRVASNCAVPCYFVACGLVPGADAPGTYKPCFRAHVEARSPAAGPVLELRLIDAAGAVAYQASQRMESGSRLQRQVPIERGPGMYRLEGRIIGADGVTAEVSSLTVTVR